MKRLAFFGALVLLHGGVSVMEYGICGTCEYIDDSQYATLILLYIFWVIGLWQAFMRRAWDAGLKSNFHGAWCFVPFAAFWFLFVPTGWHNRNKPDEMQEMWRDAQ